MFSFFPFSCFLSLGLFLDFGFLLSVYVFRSGFYSLLLIPYSLLLSVFLHSRFGLHIVFCCQRSVLSSEEDISAFDLSIDLRNLIFSLGFSGPGLYSLFPKTYFLSTILVEMRGLEPLAYALQRHRSPS